MTKQPRFTAPPATRPYRPRVFWLARALVLLGFIILLVSGSLSSQGHLGPTLWWLLSALVLAFTGMGLARFSTPTPLKPLTDVPTKHSGWFFIIMVPGMFILRWFHWDAPQILLLVALALLVGWWASQIPVARRDLICDQYRQARAGED